MGIVQILLGSAKFAGLTLNQWITIVSAVATAEPKIVAALQPLITLIAPQIGSVLQAIASHLATGASVVEVATQAHGGFSTQGEENDWMSRFGAGSAS